MSSAEFTEWIAFLSIEAERQTPPGEAEKVDPRFK